MAAFVTPWPDIEAVMREMAPEMSAFSSLYAMDVGAPGAPNVLLQAAEITGDGDIIPGTETSRMISREWLSERLNRDA
mgnify:CR=1 FL=1